jgi:hypothetical protein
MIITFFFKSQIIISNKAMAVSTLNNEDGILSQTFQSHQSASLKDTTKQLQNILSNAPDATKLIEQIDRLKTFENTVKKKKKKKKMITTNTHKTKE